MRILKTVKQTAHDNPWCTEPSLRHLIFLHAPVDKTSTASDHALRDAVVRVGRRVLIDEPLFIELLVNLPDHN